MAYEYNWHIYGFGTTSYRADDKHKLCLSDPMTSLQIAKSACQDKINCTLNASIQVFGDFCKGQQRKMDLKYACVPNNVSQKGTL